MQSSLEMRLDMLEDQLEQEGYLLLHNFPFDHLEIAILLINKQYIFAGKITCNYLRIQNIR